MLVERVANAWESARSTRSRLTKIATFADLLDEATIKDVPLVVAYLSGELRQGRIGLGYATVGKVEATPAEQASLTVADIDHTLSAIKAATGAGSKKEKERLLGELLERATGVEQDFIRRLLLGGLRQGALEGIMVEAVARCAGLEPALVRRAAMVSADLPLVATRALAGGADALEEFALTLFTAVQPMLAQSAENVAAALAKTGPAGVEWKIDGARVQVHRQGDKIEVYTRNLRDITGSVPNVVRAVAELDVQAIILDGEAVAFGAAGRPEAFQDTMSRFGSAGDGSLDVAFFDCLHLDGRDLLDLDAEQRWLAMAEALPAELCIPRIRTTDADEAQEFLDHAIAAGHEGVMVKSIDAPYEAGRRGAAWIKVKPVYTLDLVVLAVEWGSGRRQGWLSNIHLGARDPADPTKFVMLGKTFKGMTDEMLEWQTSRFLELESHREGHVVHVRPEQVVEVAIDGVQRSSRYPGGVALRFARVKRYRDDKPAAQADTLETVRAFG